MKGERPRRLIEQLIKYPNRTDRLKEEKIILAQERLQKRADRRKNRHDQDIKPVVYNVGDWVLVKNHEYSSALTKEIKKFFHLFTGPYVVLRKMGENAYSLGDPNTREYKTTQNIANLRRYKKPITDPTGDDVKILDGKRG
ncbi:hypothetical protein QE152_g162 [Popillia japonica]|uniref:Tf2-1-like SH3-like domain-containing protein n=1 Tax=Popillia japonica TaxID=7064 RepID=A0AAW1NKT8_POPJA